jgi:hypothetical protein
VQCNGEQVTHDILPDALAQVGGADLFHIIDRTLIDYQLLVARHGYETISITLEALP